jgi:hypothetical protein
MGCYDETRRALQQEQGTSFGSTDASSMFGLGDAKDSINKLLTLIDD